MCVTNYTCVGQCMTDLQCIFYFPTEKSSRSQTLCKDSHEFICSTFTSYFLWDTDSENWLKFLQMQWSSSTHCNTHMYICIKTFIEWKKVTPECGHCMHAKLHLIDLKKKKKVSFLFQAVCLCVPYHPHPSKKKKKLHVSSHLTGPVFSTCFFFQLPGKTKNKTNSR